MSVLDLGEYLTEEEGDDAPPRSVDNEPSRKRLLAADVDDFLAEPEPEYDWLVEGLLERGERLILTANEGGGKSTLGRQIGMTLGSGLHPFTFEPVAPARVLLIDCENPRRHLKRELAKVRAIAGGRYQRGHLRIRSAPAGADLTDPGHADYLMQLVEANEADVLVTGPLYKMATGDPSDEPVAKAVSTAFDRIRERLGTAILLEAHTPHANAGGPRPKRPYGASLWLRWPEYGIHLADDGTLSHWRTPRDERNWPARLVHGDTWPWIIGDTAPAAKNADPRWRPTWYMEQVSRRLEAENAAGEHPTKDALAKVIGKNRSRVLQAIDALLIDGYVERNDKRALRSIKPYRELDGSR
jgi:hypothetical protein